MEGEKYPLYSETVPSQLQNNSAHGLLTFIFQQIFANIYSAQLCTMNSSQNILYPINATYQGLDYE